MKLYTKTGDDGSTGLFGGDRVSKDDPRVAAYGEVDELNAVIGTIVSDCADIELLTTLRQIQSELFDLGAELATRDGAAQTRIQEKHIRRQEQWIDGACAETPPLRSFILPGGTTGAAQLHFARAVCRRAERAVVLLARREIVSPLILIYLNRLSDLLFALARQANLRAGVPEVPWAPQARKTTAPEKTPGGP
jgi:cob(I)alamin adenosyltransferase